MQEVHQALLGLLIQGNVEGVPGEPHSIGEPVAPQQAAHTLAAHDAGCCVSRASVAVGMPHQPLSLNCMDASALERTCRPPIHVTTKHGHSCNVLGMRHQP